MKPLLRLEEVSKRFRTLRVLDRVHLQIGEGEAVGLVGANGAGKTTLLRVAAGLIHPDSGWVLWPADSPVQYFAGERTLPPMVRASTWAGLLGGSSRDRRRIGALSRGTRQALGLQVTLAARPAGLILLDEPWDGLDPDATRALTKVLRQMRDAGAGVLISSHRLGDLEDVATRFVRVERGRCEAVERERWDGARQLSM